MYFIKHSFLMPQKFSPGDDKELLNRIELNKDIEEDLLTDQTNQNDLIFIIMFQFDFVNCFICLFYVAFYLQDRTVLNSVSHIWCLHHTCIVNDTNPRIAGRPTCARLPAQCTLSFGQFLACRHHCLLYNLGLADIIVCCTILCVLRRTFGFW